MTTMLMLGRLLAGAVVSSLVPLLNAEAIVLATALTVPAELALFIVLAVTLGQVTGKVVLYCSGKGIGNLATSGKSQRAFAMARRLRGKQGRLRLAFFASASVGLPPLYIMAPVAGIARMPMPTFLSLCFLGRFIRFYALFLAPALL